MARLCKNMGANLLTNCEKNRGKKELYGILVEKEDFIYSFSKILQYVLNNFYSLLDWWFYTFSTYTTITTTIFIN